MKRSPLETAADYAARFNLPVFPVIVTSAGKKCPAIPNRAGGQGHKDATRDLDQIERWWGGKYRNALIGMPTGLASGLIILDLDCKGGKNGFHLLADHYQLYDLPETPRVFTRSAGEHVYFAYDGKVEIRNSEGQYGLGPGGDIRGEGGWAVLPCAGSGYAWHSQFNLETVAPMPAPAWLAHKTRHQRSTGNSRGFASPEAILDGAVSNIGKAGPGARHAAIMTEVYTIAGLAAAERLDAADAHRRLSAAVIAMVQHTGGDLTKAEHDFADAWHDGFARPLYRRAGR
jgi:hypothetical protein